MNLSDEKKLLLRSFLNIQNLAVNILLESDSSDSSDSDDDFMGGGERQIIEKTQGYMLTISRMDNKTFREHFRISPNVYENVLNQLGNALMPENYNIRGVGRPAIRAEKVLLIALWILANKDTYR